jgi:hypothetical protein
MVEYRRSKKGYCYRITKSGIKKRISKKEYTRRSSKKHRISRMRKGGGNELNTTIQPSAGTITDDDILRTTDSVCILKPNVKKGVILFTEYKLPDGKQLCIEPLKTGEQLTKDANKANEGNSIRSIEHQQRYIFFRAPYISKPIDYTSIDTEFKSLYGDNFNYKNKNIAFIRVDPDKTYVYSGELRIRGKHKWMNAYREVPIDVFIRPSKKRLSEYLKVIEQNEKFLKENSGWKPLYNLYTSEIDRTTQYNPPKPICEDEYDNDGNVYVKCDTSKIDDYIYYNIPKPLDNGPINHNSEVLVDIPIMDSQYFINCLPEYRQLISSHEF